MMTTLQREYLWPFAGRRPLVLLIGLTVLVLAFFNLFPGIDIAASRLFFRQIPCPAGTGICGSFPLSASPFLWNTRQFLHAAPVTLAVLLFLLVMWRMLRSGSMTHPFDRAGLAVVAALTLGAGALVNMVLKEYWGRPRPVATDLFGGQFPFVPAGHVTDHCATNCSFVSGEAAGSFWLVALATLVPRPFRLAALTLALTVACGTSFLRVAFGGHYVSDVTLAALLSLLVFSILATTVRSVSRRAAETNDTPARG